jgi:hypothetical protein
MILTSLLLLTASAHSAPLTVPAEIAALAEGVKSEKVRTKRIELLSGLITDVKKRIGALPNDVAEEELPKVQMLYELNILFSTLKPETLNPASCPGVLRTLEQMTSPTGTNGTEISPTGRLALDVVKSVCAP